MKRPRPVAARVKRCVLVIGGSKVSHRQEPGPAPFLIDNAAPRGDKQQTTGNGRVARRSEDGEGIADDRERRPHKAPDSFTAHFGHPTSLTNSLRYIR
jgi:hypothetical protein